LIGFFIYITWFDVNDLVGGKEAVDTFKIEDLVYPVAK
jgi:hypothetical protein